MSAAGRRSTMRANCKVWLFAEGRPGVFGDGKLALLQAIATHGSLREACSALNLSYRKAWGDLRKTEACLGFGVVARRRGGADGGGTSLTPRALALLEHYRAFRDRVRADLEAAFHHHLQEFLT